MIVGRWVVALWSLLLVGLCWAQGSIDVSYPPTISTGGVLTTLDFAGSSGSNQQLPNVLTHGTSVSSPGTGYSCIWEIKKNKAYNRVSGSLYTISPLTAVSISYGWSGGTRTVEFQPPFWSWFGSRTNDEERYGEFELVLQYRPASGSYTTVSIMTWVIRPQDYNSGSGGGGGGGNGNGSNSGGTGDPTGFWEGLFSDLFIPSEASINALADAIDDVFTWGPFGILTGRAIPPPAGYASGHFDEDLKVAINIPEGGPGGVGYGAAGTYYLDLGPYEDVVTFLRYLILAILYFFFLSRMWGAVARLMGMSGGVASGIGMFSESFGAGESVSKSEGHKSAAKGHLDTLSKLSGKYK